MVPHIEPHQIRIVVPQSRERASTVIAALFGFLAFLAFLAWQSPSSYRIEVVITAARARGDAQENVTLDTHAIL